MRLWITSAGYAPLSLISVVPHTNHLCEHTHLSAWQASPPEGVVSFRQRYFLCDEHWRKGGPIFFYVGNEADVTL